MERRPYRKPKHWTPKDTEQEFAEKMQTINGPVYAPRTHRDTWKDCQEKMRIFNEAKRQEQELQKLRETFLGVKPPVKLNRKARRRQRKTSGT